MAKGPPISEDKKWKIEEDARTLARAEEIRGDKKRHAAACVELKNQAKIGRASCRERV